MKFKELFTRARKLFKKDTELPPKAVEMLIQRLLITQDEELDCGEFFKLIDEYVEHDLRGEDAARLMPLVRHHIEMCRECHEEYDALMSILEGLAWQQIEG
ncbi:MAG: hypothetical protein JXA13_08245 [Anaerolineales bacterium]|nr:hypothetical protein [Anaerolineales bacterium]